LPLLNSWHWCLLLQVALSRAQASARLAERRAQDAEEAAAQLRASIAQARSRELAGASALPEQDGSLALVHKLKREVQELQVGCLYTPADLPTLALAK
jgi:hypothetical protein